MLENVEGFLIDIDGTVLTGSQLIPGADVAISQLRAQNKKVVLFSNRGNISGKMCVEKLRHAGVEIDEHELMLASTVAAKFIKRHYPKALIWVLSDPGLHEELLHHEVELATSPEQADFLLISLFETLTYDDLNLAFRAVRNGARIIATNADKTFPNEEGCAIDVAGMIGAIEGATGKLPEIVIGKPSCFMVEAALDLIKVPAEKCMIVGDSPDSDIVLGNMHDIKTTLVLTGNTKIEHVNTLIGRRKPLYVINTLSELTK
ncbi:HAD-IIA family hydrolase [Bacillus solitudinis]|uniref:HAD-IIA family hydrolase n=1 Tax=Bacillus solitudinis TaxID=2014074 RepID=UPI000C244522|nr:HAD-IIA family hydrolase [Bacillus solitudinis]